MGFKDVLGARPFKRKGKIQDPVRKLTTVWGEGLDPAHVWEEYPRPGLVRENFTVLNGFWEYAITKEPSRPKAFEGRILVPFSPESPLSGVGRRLEPDEYLWYERRVDVPGFKEGLRCILHFEAVDQCAAVYLNGERLKAHTGGYLPFHVDLTAALKKYGSSFTLTVRVQDFTDTAFHSRGKQKLIPGGIYYSAQSGIWQTVWLELVPECFIKEVFFEADPSLSSVKVRLKLNASFKDKETPEGVICVYAPVKDLDDTWLADERPLLSQRICSREFVLTILKPKLWDTGDPWLYPVEIKVGEDSVRTYFALRSFTKKKDRSGISRLFMNHKPVFLNGVLDQGYWPDGLYTAPSDEAFIYDINQMKALGFNMIRKHAKIENRRWYYHCDRLGMMVWQDMVNGGTPYSTLLLSYLPTGFCVPGALLKKEVKEVAPEGKIRAAGRTLFAPAKELLYGLTGRAGRKGRVEFKRECAQTVRLLRGHPCIMTWVIFNEGWGQFDTKALTAFVRRLDPSRLIDSASGWFERKTGDFKSVHNYFRRLRVPRDVRLNVLSEYGGYTYRINEHSMFKRSYGYHTCTTGEEFEKSFIDLLKEAVSLCGEGLAGAIYTQVSDIEEETNGLLTYDRRICKISEAGAALLRNVIAQEAVWGQVKENGGGPLFMKGGAG